MSLPAQIYHLLRTSDLQFRGRGILTRWAASRLDDGSGFFAWPMRDGYFVAIRPDEAALDCGVAAVCFLEHSWESHVSKLMARLLHPGDWGVDIGANIGALACRMARLVGDSGKIVAFEPARRTFDQLTASIRYNRAENIVARNVALGSASGKMILRVPANVSGNASAYKRAEEGAVQTEEVEVATLDGELSRLGGRPVRLIKLDAEGGELDILRGARQTLKSYTPGIIVEWNPETASLAGWNVTELMDLVRECGPYQSKLIWHDGKLLSVDPRHIEIEPGGYVDLFLDAGKKP